MGIISFAIQRSIWSGLLSFCLLYSGACSSRNYYGLTDSDWQKLEELRKKRQSDYIPVSAVRERDGARVTIDGGSVVKTEKDTTPFVASLDGTRTLVRVQSNRGKHTYVAAAVVMGLGLALSAAGATMGIVGASRGLTVCQGPCPDDASTKSLFIAGITIGPIGNVMSLIVSPILFGVAYSQSRDPAFWVP